MDSEAKREREWYGGEYVDQVYDRQFQRTMNKTMERSWNAYMLIYEPLDPTSMETESDVSVAGLSVSDEAVADPSISRLVLRHNIEFNHIRNIFNVDHFKSVGDHSQLSVHVWPSPLMLWPCMQLCPPPLTQQTLHCRFMQDLCLSNALWIQQMAATAQDEAQMATTTSIGTTHAVAHSHCRSLADAFGQLSLKISAAFLCVCVHVCILYPYMRCVLLIEA